MTVFFLTLTLFNFQDTTLLVSYPLSFLCCCCFLSLTSDVRGSIVQILVFGGCKCHSVYKNSQFMSPVQIFLPNSRFIFYYSFDVFALVSDISNTTCIKQPLVPCSLPPCSLPATPPFSYSVQKLGACTHIQSIGNLIGSAPQSPWLLAP